MERLIMNDLIEWKNSDNRKPLILKGVRQSGKTFILKLFGQEHYEDIAYFNFEETEELKDIFQTDYNTKRILLDLGAVSYTHLAWKPFQNKTQSVIISVSRKYVPHTL